MKVNEIKIANKVNYGFYTNITFERMEGMDTCHFKRY